MRTSWKLGFWLVAVGDDDCIENKTLIFIVIPSSSEDENNEFELSVKNCVKNGTCAKLNHVCELNDN